MDDIPIHVINLPKRTDRRYKVVKALHQAKLTNYTFINAIDGLTLDLSSMERDGLVDRTTRHLTRGECGCYLSHLSIFRDILNSNKELHLILEDDVQFARQFKQQLNELLVRITNVEWDIFYVGVTYDGEIKGKFIDDDLCFPTSLIWGTHAYIMKRNTVQNIINRLLPIDMPIDLKLTKLNLKLLTIVNPLARVTYADSDTQMIK